MLSKMDNYGQFAGEACRRNGCSGIIEEHEKEGSCSCHLHPPCSYCTEDTAYCPECNWDAMEERRGIEANRPKSDSGMWVEQQKKYEQRRREIEALMRGTEPIKEFVSFVDGHTHFSQKVWGVYPPTMTREELRKKIDGTFGGRFEFLNDRAFRFIAYTD